MNRHHPVTMLVLSFVLAFVFAITWVITMTLSLSPTDLAYGKGPFEEPLIFPIMSMLASVAALITYPFLYYLLRDRQLPKALSILTGIVMTEIVLITPMEAGLGFLGAFVVYIVGLIAARLMTPMHVRSDCCPKCAYDLRGTSGGCSECGWGREAEA